MHFAFPHDHFSRVGLRRLGDCSAEVESRTNRLPYVNRLGTEIRRRHVCNALCLEFTYRIHFARIINGNNEY